MAYIELILTALNLSKLKKTLIEEKLEAIKAHEDKSYKKKFRIRHIVVDIRDAFKKFSKKIFRCSETSCGYKSCYKLGREGSCENYVLRSILGFLGGIFLTYLLYIFFIFQLNVKLTSATVICSILGCILTVGLAFSSKVRCVVLLTLPQFFSKRGRQALMAYAFILALTGPAQNTLNNMGILSESLACGQEQLKQVVKQIIDVIKKPFMAIKEAIKKVVKTVKEVVKKIKEILLKIKRIVMALVRVIKSVFEFLGKMINICNKELGTPFERCSRVFENAIADCNAKLGPLFNWLCSLTYIVKAVCYIVKIFDYVCMLVDFISNSVVGVVIRKVKMFVRHIKTMFYVRIKFSHSFQYETISSKSFTEIAKEIVAEIKGRSRGIVAFFKFMTSASMLFFMYLVFQVAYYRIKYLTSERYDNIYITKYFREIDQRRAKIGKETVLPLSKKERLTYVPINSGQLARTEKRNLSKAATTLATASIKLATHMIADYSLYWILTLISHHARYQSKVQAPNFPAAHITGEGFLATLLRSIVNAFQPVGIQLEIDTVPCLPIPIPPDFDRYVQIGITVIICWILTVLEPYGLRFRNYIMGYYHPVRAKQRTIWLYNHILRSRTSFLVLARRKLRKQFGMKGRSDEISCKDLLRSKLKCSIFRICLGSDLQKACLLCGEVFREKDKTRFIKCRTPRCPGLFCLECFADLKNLCPVCLSPIESGDLDDLDEEQDSSGDEPPPDKPKKKRKCPWFPCGKPDDDEEKPLFSKDDEDEGEENDEPEAEDKGDKKAQESDSSTDYSYSYQYDEDDKSGEPLPAPVMWRDVEMQAMPDEASMETFREGEECICIDLDNRIVVPRGHAAMVRMDIVAEANEELYVDKEIAKKKHLEDADEKEPLLDCCTCSSTCSSRHVEFIGVPKVDLHKNVRRKIRDVPSDIPCICSDLEVLEEKLPKSTMSTSTRSDCKYCRCPDVDIRSTLEAGSDTEEELRNIVPTLDLSFLKKQEKMCVCDNPVLSSRFSYVTYQEVCETPPSTSLSNRSLESSSVLSSLQNSPAEHSGKAPLLRKRNVKTQYERPPPVEKSPDKPSQRRHKNIRTQYSTPEEDSPSSMDSYEFNKAQNRKVRRYYEATKQTCSDPKCQYGRKKKSISDMFKRLLPKRNRDQSYLPLQQRDIDKKVQIQSYNYNQENWDTLSLDTNSPTYPFGTQGSTDTSEEEQELLGGKRIRGGECTHLINCRLIGKKCPQKRVRSFDAKSEFILGRTKLKDFSTLSLPPKPKPADSKELFFRYFSNAENCNPTIATGQSMKPPELPRSSDLIHPTDREDSSDYIIPKNIISSIPLGEEATPPSSDSGLSESTCAALFGTPCPQSFKKTSHEHTQVSQEEKPEEHYQISQEEELEEHSEILQEDPQISQEVIPQPEGDIILAGASKEVLTAKRSASSDLQTTRLFSKQKDQKNESDEQPSSWPTGKSLAKRKSTQLNQLLYKDDRTEISLVQKLSPDKGSNKSRSVSSGPRSLSPRPVSSLNLKISLHNTIIPEEGDVERSSESIAMRSPTSQDKIVETRDSFPLQNDWNLSDSSRTGKLILSSDKTQQTSDNDIYRTSNVSLERRTAASKEQRSLAPGTTKLGRPRSHASKSAVYYSNELPERDDIGKHNHCNCSICRMPHHDSKPVRYQSHDSRDEYNMGHAESKCSCCRCSFGNQRIPSYQEPISPVGSGGHPGPRDIAYQVTAFPPSTTDTEVPDFLPPPPPRPPYPPRMSTRRTVPQTRQIPAYRRSCSEHCNCCGERQQYSSPTGYFGEYAPQPTPYRYQLQKDMYGYQEDYNPGPNVGYNNNQFDYSNQGSSLSDLPYQNNEDYLELVEELQDTLHSRNRNRVKRAMQEFEDKSKQNKPLEKPILNYDETSESEEPIIRKIDKLRTDRKMCCAEDACTCNKKKEPTGYPKPPRPRRRDSLSADERPSHWTMDPGSGEWQKACKLSNYNRGPKGPKDSPKFDQCTCNCERRYQ